MIIKENSENLLKRGVYKIVNISTGKYYVGSTIMTFLKRWYHHQSLLRSGKHKNTYLQNSYNKYGDNDFEFQIIEVCDKDQCLVREQYWLDKLNCTNKDLAYNINSNATNVTSKEVIEKRRQTMIRKYASGEFDHLKEIQRNRIPWNKGKSYISTDHLKVPKLKKGNRAKDIETKRSKNPEIFVYDLLYNFLGSWRSSRDLQDWSLTENNNLPLKSRFKKDRMGLPSKILQAVNINKACKTNKTYKNLYFSNKPLHQEIDVEKQGELLENPQLEDNQQPSLSGNTFEGSTTNSQILDNKDGNGNTSTLQTNWINKAEWDFYQKWKSNLENN